MAVIDSKVVSLSEAVAPITDGSTVALGGHTLRRHPMALVGELVRQSKRNLHLVGWNNGIDMDLLTGAGCAAVVETSYVGMGNLGLARNFRRAVEHGTVSVIEHSELTAIDMFRGGASGLGFVASPNPLGSSLLAHNPRLREITSPFDGRLYVAVEAIHPEFALIHAHHADRWGNVLLDHEQWMDNSVDTYIARSAEHVIVSVEQIVSDEYVHEHPEETMLPRSCVDAVVEAPFGAHPCCCDAWYPYDSSYLRMYYEASATPETFRGYLEEWVYGRPTHDAYLQALGTERLVGLLLKRAVR